MAGCNFGVDIYIYYHQNMGVYCFFTLSSSFHLIAFFYGSKGKKNKRKSTIHLRSESLRSGIADVGPAATR